MEDHVFFGPSWRVNVDTLTKLARNPLYIAAQFFGPYTFKKQGPLTNPVCDMLGFEKLPRAPGFITPENADVLDENFPPDWPEMEYLTGPGYIGDFKNLFITQPGDGHQCKQCPKFKSAFPVEP